MVTHANACRAREAGLDNDWACATGLAWQLRMRPVLPGLAGWRLCRALMGLARAWRPGLPPRRDSLRPCGQVVAVTTRGCVSGDAVA
jgi:hypothetical protein